MQKSATQGSATGLLNLTPMSTSTTPFESDQIQFLLAEDIAAITKTNDPRTPVVQHLQRQLANSVLLFLEYKKCSWQSEGIAFRAVQKTFETFANETKSSFDLLGNRLRMIGQDPDLLMDAIVDGASVQQTQAGLPFLDLLSAADANVIGVIRELRGAIFDLNANREDPGTVALLVSVVRQHEEHEWIMRQMMK